MSLFPAAASSTPKNHEKEKENNDWLKNESFRPGTASILNELRDKSQFSEQSGTDSSELEEKRQKVAKHKKRKKKLKKRSPSPEKSKYEKSIKSENDRASHEKLSMIVDHYDSDLPKFQSDKTPDMDNVHFGRLYKVYTSKYYRDLSCCVGTPLWQYMKIEKSKKKKRKRHANSDLEYRYFGSKLPVADSFSVPQKSEVRKLSFMDNYVAITDTRPIDQADENDAEDIDESQERKTTKKLNRETRENPKDIDAWMKLLSWQDELMKDTLVHGRSRSLSEKKIEILNHAIKANPKQAKLHLQRLHLKSEISSDHKSLDKEWENLLFRFPNDIEVWKGYIFYINCNSVSTFSLNRTRRAFSHCIEILRSIKNGAYKQDSTSDLPAEDRLVQVFLEYTDFLSATGHTEQLTSLYQCMLELNFRSSSEIDSWEEHIKELGNYFASNEPKIGEKDSKGFNAWIEKRKTGGWVTASENANTEQDDDIEDDIDPSLSLTENWVNIEKSRFDKHWLQWRPSYEGEECDDSERIVSFSSVKDLLFLVDRKDLKMKILQNFIRSLGSAQHFGTSTSEPFSHQNLFLFHHMDDVLKQDERLLGIKPALFRSSGILVASKHNFICEVFSHLISCTTDNNLKKMLCCEFMMYHEHRVLIVFVNGSASELRKSGKEARKTAKHILSSNPELLHVWCSLALVEWVCGKKNEACKIFQTTLSMSIKTLQSCNRTEKRLLLSNIHSICKTFAILHFTMCDACCFSSNQADTKNCNLRSAVMQTLAALGDNYKFGEYFEKNESNLSSVAIMKATTGYARSIEESQSLYEQHAFDKETLISNAFPSDYFNLFICQSIFAMYSKSPLINFDNLDMNFKNSSKFLETKRSSCTAQVEIDIEHLYNFHIYILHVSSQSRNICRKVISDAATKFPFNTYFAKKLGEIDMPSYLCGNVRKHYMKICNESDSVVPWLCAIDFELKRRRRLLGKFETVESEALICTRIRNLFEHALAVGTNMGSLVLWRAYLAAEIAFGSDKVQSVYTRAINSCSWSKELHLDILAVNPESLVEVVTHMSKKGLRVRTPVEEVQLLMAM